MKILSSIFLLGSLILVQSCGCRADAVGGEKYESTENSESSEPDVLDQRTITGSFRSVKGIMDELSCYTSNGGYVKTADGEVIAVSFKDSEEVSSCDKITITGYMTSRSIEANGSCPKGMMGFLKVQTYVVGETDF